MFIIMLHEKNKMLNWVTFFVKYPVWHTKHVHLLYIFFVFLFHKIKCVGVRKGDKGLTGGLNLEPFPWQGDFLLFVQIFIKGRVFFFPRTRGYKILWKQQLLFPFLQTKAKYPVEADTPFRGSCKLKRAQRNESVLLKAMIICCFGQRRFSVKRIWNGTLFRFKH